MIIRDLEHLEVVAEKSAPTSILGGETGWVEVLPGESLSFLADYFCGDPNKWVDIYNANSATIGSDPNSISPGQQLYVPC